MSKVLIVGASDGIGLALAEHYQKAGNTVINVSRRDCPLEGVRNYRADMSKESERLAALEYIAANDLLPDLFIYSAGASMCAPVQHTEDDHLRYLWEVNYFGFVRMVQGLLPHLTQVKGKIVAVSSMAAVAPIPFDAHYSASKAALDAFLAVLSQEVAPLGIRVTSVLPGGTATEFTFKRLIYDQAHCGRYYAEAQKSAFTLGKMEQTGMSPDKAAQYIAKHVDEGRGLYYPVGPTNGATYALCKLLPQAVKGAIIRALYGSDGKSSN